MSADEPRDDEDTRELRERQEDRTTTERELAEDAATRAEERQHERRADKAAYLAEKLAERERSERNPQD